MYQAISKEYIWSNICMIWDKECPNTFECLWKNRKKIIKVLDFKHSIWINNIELIVRNFLKQAQETLKNRNANDDQIRACMHYISNWVWPHLDNTFLYCDVKKAETDEELEDLIMLRHYIFNVFKLSKINNYILECSDEELNVFVNELYKMYNAKIYKWGLSFLINLSKKIGK